MNYVELNAFIKAKGLCPTGGQAKLIIKSGAVTVNGEVETRNKKKLILGDIVVVYGKRYLVDDSVIR